MADKKYTSDDNLLYFWLKLKEKLGGKVDKVDGKGLSANDYTDDDKSKLSALYTYIENTLKGTIEEIEGLIPDEANVNNKLADKAFVNSSIATNTAVFRGTYETVASLPTTSTVTDLRVNDYAFVITTTNGNPEYQRYKYTTTGWEFEYTLNNSSFTAEQWEAIGSGITEDLVAQITTNKNSINTLNTNKEDKANLGDLAYKDSLGKADVGLGNVDNTSDANKPISTATQNALNLKANESDLSTLSGRVDSLSGTVSTINNSMVDKSSTQVITGEKTFQVGLKIGNNHYSPAESIEFDGGVQDNPNLNNFVIRGIYHCIGGTNTPSFDHANSNYDLMVFNSAEEGVNIVTQMVIIGWKWYIRRIQGSNYGAWERFGAVTEINELTNAEIDTIFAS